MNRISKYINYRDSRFNWLDKVPSTWVEIPLKHVLKFNIGWTPPTGQGHLFEGGNLWANISDLKEKYIEDTVGRISDEAVKISRLKLVPVGSLLFSFKLSVGLVSITKKEMFTNEAIASFIPEKDNCIDYLYYSLPEFIMKNISRNIYGAPILNQDLIKNAKLLLPPLEEQRKISDCLTYKIEKINNLISKKTESY